MDEAFITYGKLGERDHLEEPDVERRIILRGHSGSGMGRQGLD